MSDNFWVMIKLPKDMNKNIEYRISDKEPQNVEVILRHSIFGIQYSAV